MRDRTGWCRSVPCRLTQVECPLSSCFITASSTGSLSGRDLQLEAPRSSSRSTGGFTLAIRWSLAQPDPRRNVDPDALLLQLVRVNRTYPGPTPVRALRDATLQVRRGELLAIVGRSGSGKSTLLNVIGLLDRPSGGEYSVAGQSVAHLSDRRATLLRSRFFAFVFQQAFLLATRTAQENVELALVPQGHGASERRARSRRALEDVGLGHRIEFYPTTLSGGECQRVAIARALVQEPSVLICDEPTGNLDEQTSLEILNTLLAANRSGVAVIVATHDLSLARSLPRILTVRDGVVRESACSLDHS